MDALKKLIISARGRLDAVSIAADSANVKPHLVVEELEETIVILENIRQRFFLHTPREIAYGMGIEHAPKEFAMIAGPVPTLREMLESPAATTYEAETSMQDQEKICILRFEGTKGDPSAKVLYRHSGGWVRQAG